MKMELVNSDGVGKWKFSDDVAQNSLIFGVGNDSSIYTDKYKNTFSALSEGSIDDFNDNCGTIEKSSFNFIKAKMTVWLSLR